MKNLLKNICILSFAILLASCHQQESAPAYSKEFKQRMEDKLYPFDGYYKAKNYPFETFGMNAYKSGLKQAQQSLSYARNGQWTQQGPGNIGGRVNTIAVHPDNDQEMLLGYSIGGIHKTTNGGQSWYPVFDNEITLSLSDIAYDPNNANILYAGTGDLNITGYPTNGNGIYKSTDGGESWQQSGLTEAGIISEVVVSHQNSNTIYASSMGFPFEFTEDRGLYKSTDGGQTWEKKLYIDESTGVIDIEVSPNDDNIIYAATWSRISAYSINFLSSATTRILKSEDGGETWEYMWQGLPEGSLVRPALAMYPGDDDVVYATFSKYVPSDDDLDCSGGYYIEGLYKTGNGGVSWTEVDLISDLGWDCNVVGGFSWYFGKLRVSPHDPLDIFILGVGLMRSRNGGVTWEEATPPWWTYEVHADKHDLVFTDDKILLATDGGAYSSDILITDVWDDIEDIVATQFYRVGYNPHKPDDYFGGAQDNGTTAGNAANITEWPRLFGGDGFGVQFNPVDSNEYYYETQRGSIYRFFDNEGFEDYDRITRHIDYEGRPNWDMPYFIGIEPDYPIYCGIQKVFRSVDSNKEVWLEMSPLLVDTFNITESTQHNISALAQSTLDPNLLFAGTSDGYLWRTADGSTWDRVDATLPERYYSDVRPSPNDPAIVYASITGYEDNDNTPYIYRSTDGGLTWESIAGDMPQIAVNDIYVPQGQEEENTVVIATDAGVYVTGNEGVNWQRLGDNMPIMPIFDLAYNESTEQLMAGSHARGMWTIPMEEVLSVTTEEYVLPGVDVYPTLTSDKITIQGVDGTYNYSIYSIDAVLHARGKGQGTQEVALHSLMAGTYVINVEQGGLSKSVKFVKL